MLCYKKTTKNREPDDQGCVRSGKMHLSNRCANGGNLPAAFANEIAIRIRRGLLFCLFADVRKEALPRPRTRHRQAEKKKRSQSIRKLKLWEFHWIIKILFRADPRNQPPYVIWSCRFHAFVPVLPKLRPATIVETCFAKNGDGGNENSPDLNATCETSDHYEKTRGPCHRTQGLSLRLSDAIQKKSAVTLPPTNRHLQPATEPEALFGSRSTHNWIVYSVAWHGRCR